LKIKQDCNGIWGRAGEKEETKKEMKENGKIIVAGNIFVTCNLLDFIY